LFFFCDSKVSQKIHPPQASCDALGDCRLVLECDEILFCREAILGLNSKEISSSPKDNDLDEMNRAILLALSDESFSSGGQIMRAERVGQIPCIVGRPKFGIPPMMTHDFMGYRYSDIFPVFVASRLRR
jgi:hypothetical protein